MLEQRKKKNSGMSFHAEELNFTTEEEIMIMILTKLFLKKENRKRGHKGAKDKNMGQLQLQIMEQRNIT